jgi:hypothetical protein
MWHPDGWVMHSLDGEVEADEVWMESGTTSDGLKGKNGSSIASCIRDVNNYHHF